MIVGGGPAGSFAAEQLARRGVKVAVFEEHSEIGVPTHCAGHLSIRGLRGLGLFPLGGGIVENTFHRADFFSPLGADFSVQLAHPVTCAVNRVLFDRFLAGKAEAAGARYCLGSRVRGLLVDAGVVKGVRIERGGVCEDVSAGVVVDAEGVSCNLLRQAGLAGFRRGGVVCAVEADVENVCDVQLDAVGVFLGRNYAPGFYAWVIPRLDGTAKVGLAVRAGNPRVFLERFMRRHPVASKMFRHARVARVAFHSIPLGGLVRRVFADGFLAVGDAAGQVKPTTGGGVVFGLTCAGIAAEVASEALRRGDVSAGFLRLYQERCEDAVGFDVNVMLRLRRFLDAVSDVQLDSALRFCARLGVADALLDVEEIDFQGRMLLEVLRKPVVWATLAYFFALYLAANA
ncbi:MAG: NAD(P)/FAD-dependent oxidoreductase [Candidatus Bathyarchaeota archaeon]|nr:NAD(P)/FAD-dependent oxidoreductase [Candidatus Bathyarchaeota archaeon]